MKYMYTQFEIDISFRSDTRAATDIIFQLLLTFIPFTPFPFNDFALNESFTFQGHEVHVYQI